MSNRNLHAAKAAKHDEFYTQIADIEKELSHYKPHFEDKVVLCNCDDPEKSQFWKYFSLNFNHLGLKKLISTHYTTDRGAYKLELGRDSDVPKKTPLLGNGDFRSLECVELLDEADVVVTNPPFSLFREYLALLVAKKKSFLILGSMNAVATKDVFPLIKDGRMWLGVNSGKTMFFRVPDDYVGSNVSETPGGSKIASFGNITWFTNLAHSKRCQPVPLFRYYAEEDFPLYRDGSAINVNKVKDIPLDYTGPMGVPITFLSSHNPDQFEILGLANSRTSYGVSCRTVLESGVAKYARLIIKKKEGGLAAVA